MDAPDDPARGTGPRTATLTFDRRVHAPAATLFHAWIAPAARAVWGAPAPGVTVEILDADARVGGREVSLCKVAGQPDTRVVAGWLEMSPPHRTVGYEVVSVADRPLVGGAGDRPCRSRWPGQSGQHPARDGPAVVAWR